MQICKLSWKDVSERAEIVAGRLRHDYPDRAVLRAYAVPRGGIPAALLVASALRASYGLTLSMVEDVSESELVIDDLIDSGATREKFSSRPFYALLDKQKEGREWVVFPWETQETSGPEENIRRLIEFIGDDPTREGLLETPARVIRSYSELFSGYLGDPASVLKTFEDGTCDEMVVMRDIEFYSTCEHHLLPFFGKAHVAYIPHGKVIGASKLVRLLEVFSRRLQIQERLCQQVTESLDNMLHPLGSACILEAQHFCMTSRGVRKQSSTMVTSSLTGVFREPGNAARAELLSMIGVGR